MFTKQVKNLHTSPTQRTTTGSTPQKETSTETWQDSRFYDSCLIEYRFAGNPLSFRIFRWCQQLISDCTAMNSSKLPTKSYYLYRNRVKPLQQCIKKLFVLDFEATCEKDVILSPQEIIEFPCLVVNSTSFNIEAKFHKYVKPKFHPISPFCLELTGITPEIVKNEPEFPVVFEQFTKWLELQQQMVSPEEIIFVTCGNWDLKTILPKQCALYNLTVPEVMRRWINLKVAFYQTTGYFPRGLVDMHKRLNLSLSGRLHSGIDDCYSIVQILNRLGKNGLIFTETDRL